MNSIEACNVTKRYACGQATEEELSAFGAALDDLMYAFDRKLEEMERLEEQKENHGHD